MGVVVRGGGLEVGVGRSVGRRGVGIVFGGVGWTAGAFGGAVAVVVVAWCVPLLGGRWACQMLARRND